MKDIEIILENRPGRLALLGETLGQNKISLEGGGVFQQGEYAIAHFLVEEAERAKEVLEAAGLGEVKIHPVLIQRLRQDVPGQLGMFCRRLSDAGVNILVQYSDHNNQLVIVADDTVAGKQVADKWMEDWWK